jgi:hypothetical protein
MNFTYRRAEWIFGAFFGAWLGGIYALVSQAINWLLLPGIPLASPSGSFASYLFEYMMMGALLGVISTLPENRLAGVALGGLVAALLLALRTLSIGWEVDSFGSTLVTTLLTFLPLVVLMMPLALFIRLGVDAQRIDPDRPHLWARRYLTPTLLTLVVVLVGSLSLYSRPVRDAFRYTDQMVQQGLIAAASQKDLPEPLRDVNGFRSRARGGYSLAWSDRVETFFGPRPAGGESSQFLIITRFENDFVFACVFSDNRPVPNCTKY